jgi:hypothetical protein
MKQYKIHDFTLLVWHYLNILDSFDLGNSGLKMQKYWQKTKKSISRGRIFSHLRPFYEQAVSDLDP